MSEMQKWQIRDQSVIDALQENGFKCWHPQREVKPGVIHFSTPPPDTDKYWFHTDCPIGWNASYTLPNGTVIQSRGTRLVLGGEMRAKPTQENAEQFGYSDGMSHLKAIIGPVQISKRDFLADGLINVGYTYGEVSPELGRMYTEGQSKAWEDFHNETRTH